MARYQPPPPLTTTPAPSFLPYRPRLARPLPAWLQRVPWLHLAWVGLLLYIDGQDWLLRQGVLVPQQQDHFWALALTADLLDSALFYLNWLLMPRLFRRGWLGTYLAVLVVGLVVFCAVRIGVSYWFDEVKVQGQSQPLGYYVQVLQSYYLLLGGLILLLSFFLRLAGDYWRELRHRRELEQQHLRTELALLKTQLHPHFLFNTLNNIYSLTLHASPQAPEAVLRLAELMRYQLYESADDLVPLAREISHLQSFLTLQQLRLPAGDEADEAIDFRLLLPPGDRARPAPAAHAAAAAGGKRLQARRPCGPSPRGPPRPAPGRPTGSCTSRSATGFRPTRPRPAAWASRTCAAAWSCCIPSATRWSSLPTPRSTPCG